MVASAAFVLAESATAPQASGTQSAGGRKLRPDLRNPKITEALESIRPGQTLKSEQLEMAMTELSDSAQALTESLTEITEAFQKLQADNALSLSDSCKLRVFLSRSQAISTLMGSRARWMPNVSQFFANRARLGEALLLVKQLPTVTVSFTESQWLDVQSAQSLLDLSGELWPVPLKLNGWTDVNRCPVQVHMAPGPNMDFYFEERVETIQEKRQGAWGFPKRYRRTSTATVRVDIDGTHKVIDQKDDDVAL